MTTAEVDPTINDDVEMLEALRKFIGLTDGQTRASYVDPNVIRLGVESVGDRNPIYSDPVAAAASPHGGLVAPATMLMSWTVNARPQGLDGIDVNGRKVFRLEHGLGPRRRHAADGARELLAAHGYIAPADSNGWFEYRRYLRPGERLTVGPWIITDVFGPKQTSLGKGFFVDSRHVVFDEAGEEVAVVRLRILWSRPKARDGDAGEPEPRGPSKLPRSAAEAPTSIVSYVNEPWGPVLEWVTVGDVLPELVVELTPTQIIQGSLASQDWAPVHHDRDIAQGLGHPDIFSNVQTSSGFIGRFITDWAGADAVIEALDVRLMTPNYPYDTMTITGKVTGAEPVGDRTRVTVAVNARNSLGDHIVSTIVFTTPAKIRT